MGKGNKFVTRVNKKPRKPKTTNLEEEEETHFPTFDLVEKSKNKDKSVLRKRILILCGGADTERIYFEGLKANSIIKDNLRSVEIDILSPKSGIIDHSVKGLVWEAMQRRKKAIKDRNPYTDIWIVTDNDGWNSYRLRSKIRKKEENHPTEWNFICLLPTHICKIIFENCPRFFISEKEYRLFLRKRLTDEDYAIYADTIVQNTLKEKQFEQYGSVDERAMFFENDVFVYGKIRKLKEKNYDNTWKEYVKIAYSCICFEYWLLLHFEHNTSAFLSSEEIINYLNSDPLNKNYDKSKSYEILKSSVNSQSLVEEEIIIDRLKIAISHAETLRQTYHPIDKFFELNPYTTVDNLVKRLLLLASI